MSRELDVPPVTPGQVLSATRPWGMRLQIAFVFLMVPLAMKGWSSRVAIEPLVWGTHKKMTEIDEQELHEFMRLKRHSHGLRNQHLS